MPSPSPRRCPHAAQDNSAPCLDGHRPGLATHLCRLTHGRGLHPLPLPCPYSLTSLPCRHHHCLTRIWHILPIAILHCSNAFDTHSSLRWRSRAKHTATAVSKSDTVCKGTMLGAQHNLTRLLEATVQKLLDVQRRIWYVNFAARHSSPKLPSSLEGDSPTSTKTVLQDNRQTTHEAA